VGMLEFIEKIALAYRKLTVLTAPLKLNESMNADVSDNYFFASFCDASIAFHADLLAISLVI
jgi:hypothetical protein